MIADNCLNMFTSSDPFAFFLRVIVFFMLFTHFPLVFHFLRTLVSHIFLNNIDTLSFLERQATKHTRFSTHESRFAFHPAFFCSLVSINWQDSFNFWSNWRTHRYIHGTCNNIPQEIKYRS